MWHGRPACEAARAASLFSLLLAALLLSSTAFAQPEDQRVRVFIDKSDRIAPLDGYVPLPVTLENTDRKPRRVALQFASKPWATVTRSVPLDPGERRKVFVPLPAASRYWTITIDTGEGDPHIENLLWQTPPLAPVLVEGSLEDARSCVAGSPWDGVGMPAPYVPPGSTPAEQPPPGAALFNAESLPDLLAGYVGYRGVFLLTSSFAALPEPQRRALEAYAATGGNLYLGRDAELPASSLPLLGAAEDSASSAVRTYGFGRISHGIGVDGCSSLLTALSGEGTQPPHDPEPIRRVMRAENQPRYGSNPGADLLLEVARAPTGAFALIVLLFAGIIGPGSFIVRRRYGPHALLAFIPGTSLVTCLGIFSYGVLHEGLFTIHHSAHALTLLDEPNHRAITAATSAYYPSLAPRDVRFGAMSALVLPSSASSASQGLVLDWSDGASFSAGLLPSRTYREYVALAVEPSRARLGLRGSGAGLVVENALGGRILWGKARLGERTCQFDDVEKGGSVEAALCGEADAAPLDLSEASDRRGFDAAVERTLLAPLEDGEYLVVLEKAIFAPTGGLKLESSGDLQLVRGRTK